MKTGIDISPFGKFHYLNGKFHRIDGPAVEYNDGHQEWYEHGKHHRLDGPAVIYTNYSNREIWYYQGKQINCSSQEEFEKLLKFKAFW